MKILITGSRGFLGSHAVDYALSHGYDVVGLDLKNWQDVCDRHQVWHAIAGCDYVLHLAAHSSLAGFAQNMFANYKTNVYGLLTVLDAARYIGCVKKVVYASSSAVYLTGVTYDNSKMAQHPGDPNFYGCIEQAMSFREDEALNIQKLSSHYGKSKLIDEMIAQSYMHMGVTNPVAGSLALYPGGSLTTLGLRYFNVYGPGDEKKVDRCAPMQHFLNSSIAGQPMVLYGDGTQAKDFIYVDDAIDITFKLLENPNADGIYNVGTGVATSFNRLAEIIGGSVQYTPIPHVPGDYQYFTKANTDKLLTTIGEYRFTPVEEGMKKLVPAEPLVYDDRKLLEVDYH